MCTSWTHAVDVSQPIVSCDRQAIDCNSLWVEQLTDTLKTTGWVMSEHFSGKGTGMTAMGKISSYLESKDYDRPPLCMGTTCDSKPAAKRVMWASVNPPPATCRQVVHSCCPHPSPSPPPLTTEQVSPSPPHHH